MLELEKLVERNVSFLQPQLVKIAEESQKVLTQPLEARAFEEKLLKLEWKPLRGEEFTDKNFDTIIDLSFKRLISDTLSGLIEGDDESSGIKSIQQRLQFCSVVLDLSRHSRNSRKNPDDWPYAYFDLFGVAVDLLSWPNHIMHFWTYPESRIDWFKEGSVDEDKYNGVSNLISYKAPLSEKLRHWNGTLRMVEYNSFLNTPAHYKMKFKFEKFISELLPIYEESNFNRSATVSRSQKSGNPWNKHTIKGRAVTPAEKMTTDYTYIVDKLIMAPIEFAFKSIEFKLDIEAALSPLLDAIFDCEDKLYKTLKSNNRRISTLNSKLNKNYQSDFDIGHSRQPSYISSSEKIKEDRNKFWEQLLDVYNNERNIPRPAITELSTSNPESLLDQLISPENDFFRKQVILQLCFVVSIIPKLLDSEEIRNFYKNCYQKDNLLNFVNFKSLDERNTRKTLGICTHMCASRVKNFYITRDPTFYSILQTLLESDDRYLNDKIDGFKVFQSFTPFKLLKQEEEPAVDYSFKKFGFILLGNKQISNVWKIKTGLSAVNSETTDASELFKSLEQKYKSGEVVVDESDEDKALMQWRTLRLLRSKYLFQLHNVNEEVGLKGLFDSELINESQKRKSEFKESLKSEIYKAHNEKLEKARDFFKKKEDQKRKLEVETTDIPVEPATKKIKLSENQETSGTNIILPPDNSTMSEKQILTNESDSEISQQPVRQDETKS